MRTVMLWLFVLGSLALAHESRTVGPYRIVIGFLYNPAFAGYPNSLDLRVTQEGNPVQGLERTLVAEIIAPNGERFRVELRPAHGQPGVYRGWFIPGVPGNYVWRLYGKIGDVSLDETFSRYYHSEPAVLDPKEYTVPRGSR
ncbi:hypothetical protein [Thermus sp.]|uniref:hypothetical protein n=1 Tax=Thermus sp. TaxID=275 RepID=UPI0025DDDF5A|nr:hypothetical protein [Thermus sp.]MCS6867969.1 hypothetical protein [Thermus sp.]MDW8357511.1 hypothetical protein [Thermus sp.]